MARFLMHTRFVVLVTLFLLAPFNAAWALYEVQNPSANAPTGVTPQKPPAVSLDVTWTAPTMVAGDSPVEYVYKWNNSDTALDNTQLNRTTNDGVVNKDAELKVSKVSSDFSNDDYDSPLWYFHVKTVYLVGSTPPDTFSSDVVVGPFNFDDQAPTGTIALDTSVVGQTATTSSVNPVTLALTATADTLTVYLSNSTTKPQTGVAFANTLTHTVTDGLGQKTIYVWFEDQAGNTSSFSTFSFDMIAGKSMDPAGDFTLSIGDTQSFLILGAGGETYVWTIVDPASGDPTSVATFSGLSSGVDQVDVVGALEGAFKVKATPDGGTTVYESGTITVVQTTLTKVFDLITTQTTSTNTIGFIFENTGFTTAHELGTAVGSCTQVAKWNAQTQSYLSHRMQFPTLNDFTLNVGEAYFVTVTDAHQFTLSGTAPSSHTQALITTATTSTNAIGVPNSKNSIITAHDLGLDVGNCSQVSKWNASTQSYLSHRMQFPTLNDFQVAWGEGYFITVTQATNWPW
jgi:hypothetical protein